MKKISIALLSTILFSGASAQASILKDGEDNFRLRGYARLGLSFAKGRSELKNYSSRIGFDYDRAANEKITVGAQFEWAVNMLHGSKISSSTSGDGSGTVIGNNGDFLSNRLGNLVLKTDYGTLRAGKQWSVYSEVGDWADQFAAASGVALGVYSYNTDGGYLGTGRADNALTYRFEKNGLKVGLQYQAMGKDQIGSIGVNEGGYGANVIYNFMESFHVGVAYNEVKMKFANGTGLSPRSIVAGLKFINKKFNIALAHAMLKDSESSSSTLNRTTIFEEASGTEFYFDYKFYNNFSFEVGYNLLTQKNNGNDFEKNFYLFGIKEEQTC